MGSKKRLGRDRRTVRLCDSTALNSTPTLSSEGSARLWLHQRAESQLNGALLCQVWAACKPNLCETLRGETRQGVLRNDNSGKLVVSHYPNPSSGGRPTEIDVDVFLSQGRSGPEHRALVAALSALNAPSTDDKAQPELPVEAVEKLSRALGKAVARCWSNLPQEVQHDLFEAAVTSEGETIRSQLAVYLHGKHERTAEGVQARAMPEPDSLGG